MSSEMIQGTARYDSFRITKDKFAWKIRQPGHTQRLDLSKFDFPEGRVKLKIVPGKGHMLKRIGHTYYLDNCALWPYMFDHPVLEQTMEVEIHVY